MADIIPFSAYLIFSLIKQKENICYIYKENSMRNIFRVLMFQQLLADKHHRLRDSKSPSGSLGPASDKTKRKLSDLITVHLKFNCFLSTTVITQGTFQSRMIH